MKILGLLAIAFCAFALWRHSSQAPPAVLVAADDPSGSISRNCAGFREVAEELAREPGMRSGSQVTFLLMGSGPGDQVPSRLFETLLPPPAGAYEAWGRDKARLGLFERIEQACIAAPEARYSPVYELVKRAVGVARPVAGSRRRGYVVVKSDGIDNIQPDLKLALQRAARKGVAETPKALAGSIDNAGVVIRFCGGAELRPHQQSPAAYAPPDAVNRIWRGIFTEPDQLRFEDYCGHSDGRAGQE